MQFPFTVKLIKLWVNELSAALSTIELNHFLVCDVFGYETSGMNPNRQPPQGGCTALIIPVHQMGIICKFGKHFSFSICQHFSIALFFVTQLSLHQTDRTSTKHFLMLEVDLKKTKTLMGETFYTEELDSITKSLFLHFCSVRFWS